MVGTYPIIINEKDLGKLKVYRQGLMTVFEAGSEKTEGILRLSVYGEDGREGYLGVMVPRGEGLYLKKSLSRGMLRSFPEEISHAGVSGMASAEKTEPAEERSEEAAPKEKTAAAEVAFRPIPNEFSDRGETSRPELFPVPQGDDLLWFSTPDGKLMAFDGAQNLVALPIGDIRLPEGNKGEMREIEGKKYLIFKYKDLN